MRRALDRLGVALMVAGLPVVVAAVRALRRDWLPMGDNAYYSLRARDVFTEHHPLVGAWSSGSSGSGVEVNNLGPLQLDLLALPIRALGFGPGTVVAVSAVNLAAIVVVVVLARRAFGTPGMWVAAAATAVLSWSLGSELLIEPRTHHALVLPLLAALVAAGALAAGDTAALVPLVIASSLVAQSHLTFVLPAVGVAVVAVAIAARGWRGRPGWKGAILVGSLVLALCWGQTVYEELRPGDGNLSATREARAADREAYGWSRALRASADVVLPPDGWWRPSFSGFDPAGALPNLGLALAMLTLLAGALAVLAFRARRAGWDTAVAFAAVAVTSVGAAVVAAAMVPIDGPFGAVSGNFRFLWPTAAFATAVIVLVALQPPGRLARGTPAFAAVAVVAAVAALPTSYQSPAPAADAPLLPAARELYDELAAVDLDDPVAFERGALYFGEPFTYVAIAGLQDAGVDLRFDEPVDLARFGSSREVDDAVEQQVVLVVGPSAADERPGAQLLARATPESVPDRSWVAVWLESRSADPDPDLDQAPATSSASSGS